MDIAGIEAANLPFIVKNETGMHISVKPDDSFEVRNSLIYFIYWCGLQVFLPAGLREAQPCRSKNVFFAPQGRHVTPINVKFGMMQQIAGPLPCASFHVYRGKNVGIQPPNCQNFEFWP